MQSGWSEEKTHASAENSTAECREGKGKGVNDVELWWKAEEERRSDGKNRQIDER